MKGFHGEIITGFATTMNEAAARGERDPYRRAVADFAVAHTRAMLRLLDAVPEG